MVDASSAAGAAGPPSGSAAQAPSTRGSGDAGEGAAAAAATTLAGGALSEADGATARRRAASAPRRAAAERDAAAQSVERIPAAITLALERQGLAVKKLLGQGAFGSAILVETLSDGAEYVVKVVDLTGMRREEKQAALREVNVLRVLSHPNIVGYHGSFMADGHFMCIALEYADGGDMSAAIRKARTKGRFFSESRILFWFCQLASALQYTHAQRILHRDLKSSNIFLAGRDKVVKVGDFGISRVLNSDESLASTVIGTPYYLSPELIEGAKGGYSYKSDVWSLGCVLCAYCRHDCGIAHARRLCAAAWG